MKPSPYLHCFPCPDRPGYRILYSARKASLLLLEEELASRAAQGEELPPEATTTLSRLGLVVADPEAEREAGRNLLADINRENPSLNVAVILTLACNFACRYCYEGNLKEQPRPMIGETAARLVEFLKERFAPGKKNLVLHFYGGEPLLATERIKEIAAPLQQFAQQKGANFGFSLVTNGSLLTPPIIEELKPFGLRIAKITLDGPADVHDRSRPFKSGEGSFETILGNVADCCGLVGIGIQGNYTRENYQRFPELLDLLMERGVTPDKLLQVGFGPVLQTRDQFTLADFHDGCCSANEPWLVEASIMLREEILKRGYPAPKITPSPCMVDVDHAFTVHVDGGIYQCLSFIGHREYQTGDIWQGVRDYREIYNLDHWRRHEECRDCSYLPLCFGGCRYMEFQRHGAIKGVNCQKEYWDAALGKLIQQSVRWMQKKS
ncbi:MAG: geopeptide radical SAM maturase [Desulfobacteraceae bacterium]|nr:geopeptide radical SAM maturase [Desulfobacteraceae bacterium]